MHIQRRKLSPQTKNNSTDCESLVQVIEELLERRRQETRDGRITFHIWSRDDWPREWTPSELRDTTYSSYLALRSGKLKRPPSPSTVIDIANYLECNLEERNRLLVSARYAPIPPYLQGGLLEDSIKIARDVIDYIPLPSYVINRDWNILLLNQHIFKIIGLGTDIAKEISSERLNILHLIFDPKLPLYQSLNYTPNSWNHIARRNVYGFKIENSTSQYDDWFNSHVQRLMKLPRFKDIWNEVQLDWKVDSEMDFPYYVTEILAPNGKPVKFRSLLTSLGNYDYPQIVSYVPFDDLSRMTFTELGVPTPDNGWSILK